MKKKEEKNGSKLLQQQSDKKGKSNQKLQIKKSISFFLTF